MIKLSYDLHIHSCLSPCGDDNMTPANIARMAHVKGIDVIALTDHNSCKNCGPFLKHCNGYGILAIPGIEVTTIEEVHALCLFEELDAAMDFDRCIYNKLIKIQNNESIFGKQIIYDENDSVINNEKYLLINAVKISFKNLYNLVKGYNGVMIPAHIDREANSLISNLGFIADENKFNVFEIKDKTKLEYLKKEYPYLEKCQAIQNSDAHYLEHINETINYINIEKKSIKAVLEVLKGKY